MGGHGGPRCLINAEGAMLVPFKSSKSISLWPFTMSHAQGCRMLSARISRSRSRGLSNIVLTKSLSGSLDGSFGKPFHAKKDRTSILDSLPIWS